MKRFYFLYYLIVIVVIVVGFTCDFSYDRQFIDNRYNKYQYSFIRS